MMEEIESVNFLHKPVMLDEVIEGLAIKPDGVYVDGTAGGGGHSSEIAKRLTDGRLIAIDRDADAVVAAGKRLSIYGDRVTVVHGNYSELDSILDRLGIEKIDGFLIDLGVSSYQLDNPERGFSYMNDAPLDMRMDRDDTLTAYDVVNGYIESELRRIIFEYGEEKFARNIAQRIVTARETSPIERTGELAEIIKGAIPAAVRATGHHPAKRTFQAIRIEVNSELPIIAPSIKTAVEKLNPKGRAAVITFHSLEDRAAKGAFTDLLGACTCPPDFPVCVCGRHPIIRLVNRKPLTAGETELNENPRSRSAKLRVAEKL